MAKNSMRMTRGQAQQVSMMIDRKLNRRVELKYEVFGSQPSINSTTPYVASITDISQGDTDTDRNGDRINYRGLEIRQRVAVNPSQTLAAGMVVRRVIFQWLPNDATPPIPSNVLLADPFTGTVQVVSTYNHDGRDQYRILNDETWYHAGGLVGAGVAQLTGTSGGYEHKIISVGSIIKHVQYSASGVTGTNKLYIMYLTDMTASFAPLVWFNAKLTYEDP